MASYHVPDSTYSWFVLLVATLSNAVYAGVMKCQGALYLGIVYTYGVSRQQASRPLSVLLSIRYLSGLVVGPLNHYFSYRMVMSFAVIISVCSLVLASTCSSDIFLLEIFLGILGLGLGLVVPSAVILLSTYFRRNRGKALVLYSAGYPIAGFVYPILADIWLETFSLRAIWLIIAAIFVQMMVLVVAVRPMDPSSSEENLETGKPPTSKEELGSNTNNDDFAISTDQKKINRVPSSAIMENVSNNRNVNELPSTSSNKSIVASKETLSRKIVKPKSYHQLVIQLLKTYKFYTLMCIVLAEGVSSMTFVITIIDHGLDAGLKRSDATHFLLLESLGDLCGRLLITSFIDKKLTSNEIIVAIGFALSGTFYFVLAFASSYWLLACVSFVLGFCYGFGTSARYPMYPALGVEKSSAAFGIGEFTCGLVMPVIPTLIGIFRDGFGTYFHLYIVFGAFRYFVIIFLLADEAYTRFRFKKECSVK